MGTLCLLGVVLLLLGCKEESPEPPTTGAVVPPFIASVRAVPQAPPTPPQPIVPQPPIPSPAPAFPTTETTTPDGARVYRGLLVASSPPLRPEMGGRLRMHSDGSLGNAAMRQWAGIPVPSYVPIGVETRELFLLDRVDGGHLAFYRELLDAPSCSFGSPCAPLVRLYRDGGELAFSIDLTPFIRNPHQVEVQDVRYASGVVYYNEGCPTYSREAGGHCSQLVAIDGATARELYRTPELTSNGYFLVEGDVIVSGYGFTDEDDFLYLFRRSDGSMLSRVRLPAGHDMIRVASRTASALELDVDYYYERHVRCRVALGATPRLTCTGMRATHAPRL